MTTDRLVEAGAEGKKNLAVELRKVYARCGVPGMNVDVLVEDACDSWDAALRRIEDIFGAAISMPVVPEYPRVDGDFLVLGPEIFTDADGRYICWKGENYARQVQVSTNPGPVDGLGNDTSSTPAGPANEEARAERKYPHLWLVEAREGSTAYVDGQKKAFYYAKIWEEKGHDVTITPPVAPAENGEARWTVSTTYRAEGPSETSEDKARIDRVAAAWMAAGYEVVVSPTAEPSLGQPESKSAEEWCVYHRRAERRGSRCGWIDTPIADESSGNPI